MLATKANDCTTPWKKPNPPPKENSSSIAGQMRKCVDSKTRSRVSVQLHRAPPKMAALNHKVVVRPGLPSIPRSAPVLKWTHYLLGHQLIWNYGSAFMVTYLCLFDSTRACRKHLLPSPWNSAQFFTLLHFYVFADVTYDLLHMFGVIRRDCFLSKTHRLLEVFELSLLQELKI